MGVAPEAMNKCLHLVIGSRHFYLFILGIFYFFRVAPEHLGKNLYLIKGSRDNLALSINFWKLAVEFFCYFDDVIVDDSHDLYFGN